TGIEVDEVARRAAEVGEVFDRQTQSPRAGRTDHQPVAALRKRRVAERCRELLVVGLVVIPTDALLRHAGGAAGLEDRVGTTVVSARYEALMWLGAQQFAVEVREAHEVLERCDFALGIPTGGLLPVEPVGRAG